MATLLTGARQVVTCAGPARARRGAEMRALEVLDGAAVAIDGDRIVQVGHIEHYNPVMSYLEKAVTDARYITAERLAPFTPRGTEVGVVLDVTNWMVREVPRLQRAPWRDTQGLGTKRKRIRVTHEPYGVIAVITPWNYPFLQVSSRVVPALMLGNTVVLKPSELSPSAAVLLRDLLLESGVPEDACQIVQGDGRTGAALVAADIDKVCFTGSVAAGRAVARACADRFVPTSLELGGSDAAIVLSDADARHAASGLAWGRFSCAGQTCIAPKRIFVEAPLYDTFVAEVQRVVAAISTGTGDDVEVGATGSQVAVKIVDSIGPAPSVPQ